MTRATRQLRASALAPTASLLLAVVSSAASAQSPRDTLTYSATLSAALAADPRTRQLELQRAANESRLRGIAAERLPSLSVDGQAQYQSVVSSIPVSLPGVSIPTPPHDTYDAHLGAEEVLVDPTRTGRTAVERARLAEQNAQLRTTLYALRQEVTEAYFTAASLQARTAEVDAAIADLEARKKEALQRFRAGTGLRADTASLAAAIIERRQDRLALDAERSSALARLAQLTNGTVSADATLALPSVDAQVKKVLANASQLRARPEYEQYDAARRRIDEQLTLAGAQERPRISAYGRAGYGKPGLNFLSRDFQSYWLAGVQLHWTPWRWGATDREREQLQVERDIATSNEEAFTRQISRAIEPQRAAIAQLDSSLALDASAIAMREQIARDAASQLREGVITAATYADRSTELLVARIRRAQHRVALEQARVTLLTTLGVEVR